jgi:hypothetical protein
MISKFRKKPKANEYYMLSANNGQNYYHIDETQARKHIEIRKNDLSSSTEWVLYHVIEDLGKKGMKVLDTATNAKRKRLRESENSSEPFEENLSELDLMMKHLAGEMNAEENELTRIPRRK